MSYVNFSKPVTKYSLVLRMKEQVMLTTFQSRLRDKKTKPVKKNSVMLRMTERVMLKERGIFMCSASK